MNKQNLYFRNEYFVDLSFNSIVQKSNTRRAASLSWEGCVPEEEAVEPSCLIE